MADADHPLLAKPAALQTATKATVPGVLSLCRRRAAWSPNDPTAAQPVGFEYATLTGALQRAKGKPMLRVPLPTGARVFVLASVADTDAVVDLLTPAVAAAREGAAAGGGAAAKAKGGDKQEAAKKALLEEDK